MIEGTLRDSERLVGYKNAINIIIPRSVPLNLVPWRPLVATFVTHIFGFVYLTATRIIILNLDLNISGTENAFVNN